MMNDLEVVQVGQGRCIIQRIAGDGNCLFSSVAHQIFQYDVRSNMHASLTQTLREMAVEFLDQHYSNEDIRTLVRLRVDDEFPCAKGNNEYVIFKNFLHTLATDGIFGASESLLALATIFKCEIMILREQGYDTTVTSDETDTNLRIQIVYRGTVNNWNHYDSFVAYADTITADDIPQGDVTSVTWWDRVHTKDGVCIVLRTPMDGNCLFSATVHQLFGSDMGSSTHDRHIISLRKQVVAYLRHNAQDRRIRILLAHRIEEYAPRMAKPYTDDAYNQTIDRLSHTGVWAGTETLTAIAELFRCNVQTVWEGGSTTNIAPRQSVAERTVKIVLRKCGQRWNHYDSFLCFENVCCGHSENGIGTQAVHSGIGTTIVLSDDDDCVVNGPMTDTIPLSQAHSNTKPISERCHGTFNHTNTTNTSIHQSSRRFKIGTWNVRGANLLAKRDEIDRQLSSDSVGIAALQETKMTSRTCDTRNYKWLLGKDNGADRNARRIAFLVHRSLAGQVHSTLNLTHNVQVLEMTMEDARIWIVNAHIPHDDGDYDFGAIRAFILKYSDRRIILLGDFNAHLGRLDLTMEDKSYIGPQIGHDYCNINGEELKNIIHAGNFNVNSTWSRSSTVRVTWRSGDSWSQIDHMMSNDTSLRFQRILATWSSTVQTDHALLMAEIELKERNTKRKRTCTDNHESDRRYKKQTLNRWDLTKLKDETHARRYKHELALGAKALLEAQCEDNRQETSEVETLWTRTYKLITRTAATTLTQDESVLPPERQRAQSEYNHLRSLLQKRPHKCGLREKVVNLSRRIEELKLQQYTEECNVFFRDIESVHPRRRTALTYRSLKTHRRTKSSRKADIPISHWENDLRQAFQGTIPEMVEDNDHTPLESPPSFEDIAKIVECLKNGTASGPDRIAPELLKHAPPELIQLITQIIEQVWINNDVPNEWLDTTQVPLPKVNNPKEINDYRRIALSSAIYKVYAAFLLQQLKRYVVDIPLYQAGFLPNRSTDDHIFTLRRMSEERWRKGFPTYILALDLNKAFDRVNTHHLARILQHYGVPAHLINRIVAAILQEHTTVLWQGRRTHSHERTQGIKQGCPISPFLFVIMMDYAIQRACNRLRIDMNLANMQLPLLLAYADDLVIVTDSISSMTDVVRELEIELAAIGLTVNAKKSNILLRDPIQCHSPLAEEVLINGKHIKVAATIKYLGIYLSADLHRRGTVMHRIQAAYRTLYMLMPFLKRHRLPMDTLLHIYHTVIAPTALYGLKVATLVKRNRQSLRRMECAMIKLLGSIARQSVSVNDANIQSTLRHRTINRKIRIQRLKYWGHVSRRPGLHVLQRAMKYSIPGKKKVGRSIYTWNTSLQRDLRRTRDRDWDATIRNTEQHNEKCYDVYNDSDTDESEY